MWTALFFTVLAIALTLGALEAIPGDSSPVASGARTVEERLKALETWCSSVEARLTLGQQRRSSAAFHARLTQDTLMDADPTEFGQVDMNVGNGYDSSTVYRPSAAFYARLGDDVLLTSNPALFNLVELNTGGGYDPFTGIFSPPVAGVYFLSVYAVTTEDEGRMYIRKNNAIQCQAYVDGTPYDTATCSAIVELNVGDSVTVTGDDSDPAGIRTPYSGFLGHIIEGPA